MPPATVPTAHLPEEPAADKEAKSNVLQAVVFHKLLFTGMPGKPKAKLLTRNPKAKLVMLSAAVFHNLLRQSARGAVA